MDINNILNIYKPIGISPLNAITILQKKFPEFIDVPICYAGRLDPMANGVLILLTGNMVHKLDEHLKLDKEYEAEILFGLETDTYDILGISSTPQVLKPDVLLDSVKKELKNLQGKISLPLPPYSSYKIKRRPLFMWAREGRLNEIEIPMRTTQIYSTAFLGFYKISTNDMLLQITEKINKVKGDFRQKKIITTWENNLSKNTEQKYLVVKMRFNVESGTYIRSIAAYLGQKLGTGAILFNLIRTKVDNFDIKNSIKL